MSKDHYEHTMRYLPTCEAQSIADYYHLKIQFDEKQHPSRFAELRR